MAKYKINFTDEAEEDYLELPLCLTEECDEMLDMLANNIYLGQKLKKWHGKDLSDCRKIYFGDYNYRIVYRIVNDTLTVKGITKATEEAQILGIGERAGEAIYNKIATRLNRFDDNI